MRFIIKKVGEPSYLQKIGESSVARDDIWFTPCLADAITYDYYFDAMEVLILCYKKWDTWCVMVEVE